MFCAGQSPRRAPAASKWTSCTIPRRKWSFLHRERLLQEVRSPYQRELIPEAVAAHREWAGPRVYVFVQAYNTNRVKSGELPKPFTDLLDPRWKGRIAVEAKEQEWFFTLVREMGEEAGLKFFRSGCDERPDRAKRKRPAQQSRRRR